MNSSPLTRHFNNQNPTSTTMDANSLCSTSYSEISDGLLSHDTFEITRRARQDRIIEGRLDRPLASHDLSFPDSSSNPHMLPITASPCSLSLNGKRKVSFAGQKVINEGASEWITEEEMHTRWWSQEDLDDIKKSAKEMSLKLRKLAKERGCYVETAHKKTSLMLTNDFQELVKMSASSPDQDLRHWCARSDGRRGLERFACRDYGNMRKDDVLGTRQAVFQEQDRQRKLQTHVPENIAKASKARSRRSRTFSLFMGEADAQGATRGVTRSRSKRVKVSHNAPKPQQPQPQTQQRHVANSSSQSPTFSVDAPLVTSSA